MIISLERNISTERSWSNLLMIYEEIGLSARNLSLKIEKSKADIYARIEKLKNETSLRFSNITKTVT